MIYKILSVIGLATFEIYAAIPAGFAFKLHPVEIFSYSVLGGLIGVFVAAYLGDIIKNEVTVAFGRNEDNKAIAYATLAQGQGYQPVQKLKVEPMTLKALVRERLESGLEMPSDLFNMFTGNRTKITRSK